MELIDFALTQDLAFNYTFSLYMTILVIVAPIFGALSLFR
jgi:hypothetical protein